MEDPVIIRGVDSLCPQYVDTICLSSDNPLEKAKEVILEEHTHLKASLNTWHLWGIAVGLVISGEYFGWSYGWASAGTIGFLAVTVLVATMYCAFIFSF